VVPYLLPFSLDRVRMPRLTLANTSDEPLRGVTLIATGRVRLAAPVTPILRAGDAIGFDVRGDDLAVDSAVIVRWLRPDGSEWLWRFVL